MFGRAFTDHGYRLSFGNELVVSGCNVVAMLFADISAQRTRRIVGGCATFCTVMDSPNDRELEGSNYKLCSTGIRCCQAPLSDSSLPKGVQAKWMYDGNHTAEQQFQPVNVFVAEQGWVDQTGLVGAGQIKEAPLLLEWKVTRDLPQVGRYNYTCSQDVRHVVCKSKHSLCLADEQGYYCLCDEGYEGNPYLSDGCQDVDECKLPPREESQCFGECTNTIGSYQCRCPPKTFGNPNIEEGCIPYNSTTMADALLPTVARVPIGKPGCSTSCGNVSVPYPFGFGPSGCYWPGLNLTCDTSKSHRSPRLLLDSNGTLEVVDISLTDSTLRVIHTGNSTIDVIGPSFMDSMMVEFQLPEIREPYMLSTSRNEFILFGRGVQATLDDGRSSSSNTNNGVISGCVSTCNSSSLVARYGGANCRAPRTAVPMTTQTYGQRHCSGLDGCCHAPISEGRTPKRVKFKVLNQTSTTLDGFSRAFAFISAEGLSDQWYMILSRTVLSSFDLSMHMPSPIVLQWAVKQGFSLPDAGQKSSLQCPLSVSSSLCKSDNSGCRQENGGYTCHCSSGYVGNPYIANGCQDSCKVTAASLGIPCFGHCNLNPGQQPPFECLCPRGTHGDPYKLHGCVSSSTATGLIVGFSIASGPALLLFVLGIISIRRKIKEHGIKAMKQQYFNQNRGQLLQQLVSQKSDIAERMIIPVDELAKATNNFDKAREIGGGGHGTVYKGILSDLHVVAIKKSKITLQKEIDEFINEVAILSQINHKNVVKLCGCCLETEVPLLVYEFIPNGTLYHHLHAEGQERSLSWSNRLRIATEIAISLAYLHSSVSIPIIHRDIKSSNILLDDTMTSKISDFGASRYTPLDNTDKTTRIQGTFGYLDPECFYTGRLTDKSDVYSFGVILVELLTRKKPTCSHLSNEVGGLVPHFVNLLASGNLVQIMDPQVLEEGGKEVQEVAMLAASCVNLRGEERPTMRQVEHTLEGLQQGSNKKYKKDHMVTEEFENGSIGENYPSGTSEWRRFEESSRRYSLEQEMMISAKYPRWHCFVARALAQLSS